MFRQDVSSVRYFCPSCGQSIVASGEARGKIKVCPNCKDDTKVPLVIASQRQAKPLATRKFVNILTIVAICIATGLSLFMGAGIYAHRQESVSSRAEHAAYIKSFEPVQNELLAIFSAIDVGIELPDYRRRLQSMVAAWAVFDSAHSMSGRRSRQKIADCVHELRKALGLLDERAGAAVDSPYDLSAQKRYKLRLEYLDSDIQTCWTRAVSASREAMELLAQND